MLTVHQANSAEISIALIPVLGCVESTLTARLPITSQCVSVTRDTLVTPSCPAGDLRHLLLLNQSKSILVTQIPVDQTASLQGGWETGASVTVCRRCWDLLPTVDPSVRSTKTVPLTKLVSTESARTRVRASVVSMLTAGLETTSLSVCVIKVISETHSLVAVYLQAPCYQSSPSLAIPLRAALTPSAQSRV